VVICEKRGDPAKNRQPMKGDNVALTMILKITNISVIYQNWFIDSAQ
jgi:hypothetical protein